MYATLRTPSSKPCNNLRIRVVQRSFRELFRVVWQFMWTKEARQIAFLSMSRNWKHKISEVNWKHKRSVTEKLWFQSHFALRKFRQSPIARMGQCRPERSAAVDVEQNHINRRRRVRNERHYYYLSRPHSVLPPSSTSNHCLGRKLSSRFRCIAFDQCGYGASSPLTSPNSLSQMADTDGR